VKSRHSRALRFFLPALVFALVAGTITPAFAAIRAGDTLYIKVWNHPELSEQVTVDADGGVRVPLSGVVDVGGLEETQASKKLADALRADIKYPAVSVETISQGKNLFVSGGPGGVLKYDPGETLAVAIADLMQSAPTTTQSLNAAGQTMTTGADPNAALRARIDLHHVKLRRDGNVLGDYDTIALGQNGDTGPSLEPGDTIVFSYKPIQVRVIGDVALPGTTYLAADQSLSEAVTQAGGVLPTSASNHILLQRDGVTRSLALGDPAFTAPAQSGDLVTVPAAPRVNVVGTVVTPGVVALKTDATLLSAMYTAGGPTKQANLRDVQVVHDGKSTTYNVTALTHGDMSQNPTLQDGDTVVVPQGHNVDWTGIFGILSGIAAGLATRVPL
jgi:protein involved in polysaccharide export with SLBB domain